MNDATEFEKYGYTVYGGSDDGNYLYIKDANGNTYTAQFVDVPVNNYQQVNDRSGMTPLARGVLTELDRRASASKQAIGAFVLISLNGYAVGAGGGSLLFWESAALAVTTLKEFKEQQEANEPDPIIASVKSALKEKGLPTSGKIRFVPPKNWHSSEPLKRGPQGGYIDRFGNEWVRDPIKGEWDVQLGRNATRGLRSFSNSGKHVNVSPNGRITH